MVVGGISREFEPWFGGRKSAKPGLEDGKVGESQGH